MAEVSIFTFYERAFAENSLKSLRFNEYNDEWFDFVILNRDLESTEQKHDYDIVEGPVADDKVQRHITKYLNGEISRTEFFYKLTKYPKPSHQICFCTINSLRMLKPENNKSISRIEDITESIIEQLILDFDYNEEKAADIFFSSAVFIQLSNETTNFYQKSWQENYDEYEIKNFLGVGVRTMNISDMFAHKLVALLSRGELVNRDIFDCWYFMKQGTPINKQIVEILSQKTFADYLQDCINMLEQPAKQSLLNGIGDLVDNNMKSFVRNKLQQETVFLLKSYQMFPLLKKS